MSQVLLIPGIGRLNLQRLLFGANEVGGIWDWSDRSTMFQDHLGTTPITASGQTRGLHLDKSRGLVLGAELVTNGGFDTDTAWTKGTGWTISGGRAIFAGGADANLEQTGVVQTGRWYKVTLEFSGFVSGSVNVRIGDNAINDATFSTNGVKEFYTFSEPGGRVLLRTNACGGVSVDNISVRELPGNHRYQSNLSNRPQYIEDETGHYGLYDGVDDWDETNAVNFTGTDKMTVWWGGRKLSDAASGTLFESSTNASSNDGTFLLRGPWTATPGYGWFVKGTLTSQATTSSGHASPISNVLCGISDISADLAALRIDGVQVVQSTSDQGTGNYGNHKLYFGRRGGTSLPANIREYMTIILGAQTPTPLIGRVEREVRRKIRGLTW